MAGLPSDRVFSPAMQEMESDEDSTERRPKLGIANLAGESAKNNAKGESVRSMVSSRYAKGTDMVLRYRGKRNSSSLRAKLFGWI